jgi:hypothetical protein
MKTDKEKTLEAIGKQSLVEADKEAQRFARIFDLILNEKEFNRIWNDVSSNAKLFFIKDSMKYILKEKGKETETKSEEMENKIEELKKNQSDLQKLINS